MTSTQKQDRLSAGLAYMSEFVDDPLEDFPESSGGVMRDTPQQSPTQHGPAVYPVLVVLNDGWGGQSIEVILAEPMLPVQGQFFSAVSAEGKHMVGHVLSSGWLTDQRGGKITVKYVVEIGYQEGDRTNPDQVSRIVGYNSMTKPHSQERHVEPRKKSPGLETPDMFVGQDFED